MKKETDIEVINARVWKSFDFIKSTNLPPSSYHVILFILVLEKYGVLPNPSEENKNSLYSNFKIEILEFGNPELKQCFEYTYLPIIEKLSIDELSELISKIKDLDLNPADLDFSKLFDALLYRLFDSMGKMGAGLILPSSLANFMMNEAKIFGDDDIYNPFAGTGTFGIKTEKNIHYIGQELIPEVWAQGVLRRLAYGKATHTYYRDDSFRNWPTSEKFDLIISAPPFGKIKSLSSYTNYRSADEFVIGEGLKYLKDNGKIILLVPNSFLFDSGSKAKLRQNLVEKDLIEKIISLPAGILNNTGIKSSILILNKQKPETGFVEFIDANHFIVKEPKKVSLNYKELTNSINSKSSSEAIKRVPTNDLIQEGYNLEVEKFIWKDELELIDNSKLTTLGNILEPIKGQKPEELRKLKSVSIKNLVKDELDFNLKIESLENIKANNRNYRIIAESCLLVARIGNNLKPTYFEFLEEPIAVSSNVMAFKIIDSKINLDYLINELYSDFVKKQINLYSQGTTLSRISIKDFLKINIYFLSPEEQRIKMEGVKEAHIRSKEKEIQLKKELIGFKDESFRDIASLKHTFRQYLNALKSNVSGTKKFLNRNEGQNISMNMMYSNNLNQTFGDHLQNVDDIVNSLNQLLDMREAPKSKTDNPTFQQPLQLVKKAQKLFKNPDVFKFPEIFIDEPTFSEIGGLSKCHINIAEDDFFNIFSNIISNAVNHGFQNASGGNLIRTELSADQNFLILEISNNGLPLKDGLSFKRIITRGEKTSDSKGSGIGGSDIYQIMKAYDGEVDIINDPDDEFPVKYILKFPQWNTIATF